MVNIFGDRGGEEGGSRVEGGSIGPVGRIGPSGSKGDAGKEGVHRGSGEIVEQKDLKVIKKLLDQKAIAVHRNQRDLLVQ